MSNRYANIIVDISHESVDRKFQYRIPDELSESISLGMAVYIPFGRGNQIRKGYILEMTGQAEYEEDKIKEIKGICKEETGIEDKMIRLAGFLKNQYGSTMITALKTVLPARQKIKQLESRSIHLISDEEKAKEILVQMIQKHQTARARLLKELLLKKVIPYSQAVSGLHVTAKTIKELEQKEIVKITNAAYYRNPVQGEIGILPPAELSPTQRKVIEEITQEFTKPDRRVCLLHGITGSGKTEVYMELIAEQIRFGRQAIVLIPEIALTYQTVKRFVGRFGTRVSILNSRLSMGERYDQCERARRGELDVMIGPRSALFTPFQNLGIIILDEEHEGSYKSETMPKYHAREVAVELAGYHKAGVVLGSATPSLEAYSKAKKGEYRLFELSERLTGGVLPKVDIVDLRSELKAGNRSIFSKKLQELLAGRLQKKEQTMLFINRRGYAGFISCRSCGHVMKCPHCDVSLSEHKNGQLICHYCGYSEPAVKKCPVCTSPYILGFKAGTQQIEEQLHKLFPQAAVLRMDADTTKQKDSYSKILSAFSNQEADILVGTQMIVKGHDFPQVTLVGILAADLSLHQNDFRAGEKTFQLLTQALGRAGRGRKAGEVVIQTYRPDHYSILRAADHDYKGFYEEEILYRSMMGYPPVSHMLAVVVMSKEESQASALADTLIEIVKKDMIICIGPAPAGVSKINDVFRFVFYMKHSEMKVLTAAKDKLEQFLEEEGNRKETVLFDFDPMNTY